jgi:NADH:ubiquinone oxidoreductase subunit 6 (subunit J)
MDIVIFILASSIFVISNVIGLAVSPIAAVFTLIVVFLVAAFYVWVISLPFFALIFIIIYVGAIAVLFLFVVIMIDQNKVELSEEEHFGSPIV